MDTLYCLVFWDQDGYKQRFYNNLTVGIKAFNEIKEDPKTKRAYLKWGDSFILTYEKTLDRYYN